MKNLLLILLLVFACESIKEPISIDGKWSGYAKITGYKVFVEFDLEESNNKISGIFIYGDTLSILPESYIKNDSIVLYIDHYVSNANFHFNGKFISEDCIRGTYSINGISGLRTEPFEIYKNEDY